MLAEPVLVDGTSWVVRASIGMAEAITGLTTGEEALRNADVAMCVAKERGKSRIATYDAALHAASLDRMALRAELATAVREGQLVLHHQPTVDLVTGEVSGFEALVRWLRESCAAAASMQAPGVTPAMSVNVSPQQLVRSGFVDEVREVLQSTGLAPDRLVLEVTETALLDDLAAATTTLTTLRRVGVRIAIDDFGTGYSSLSYLSQLPVDILEVDKSFIDKVTTEEHARSATLAILDMSHTMRLQTVAEGVETAEQAQWLTEMKCGRAQGFLWPRPVPLAEARAVLAGGGASGAGAVDEDPEPLAV